MRRMAFLGMSLLTLSLVHGAIAGPRRNFTHDEAGVAGGDGVVQGQTLARVDRSLVPGPQLPRTVESTSGLGAIATIGSAPECARESALTADRQPISTLADGWRAALADRTVTRCLGNAAHVEMNDAWVQENVRRHWGVQAAPPCIDADPRMISLTRGRRQETQLFDQSSILSRGEHPLVPARDGDEPSCAKQQRKGWW